MGDREQEAVRPGEGAVCEGRREVDRGRLEGSQGARCEGIRGDQEGLAAVQEGQGALRPVSTTALLRESASDALRRSLRCVGNSTPGARPVALASRRGTPRSI